MNEDFFGSLIGGLFVGVLLYIAYRMLFPRPAATATSSTSSPDGATWWDSVLGDIGGRTPEGPRIAALNGVSGKGGCGCS